MEGTRVKATDIISNFPENLIVYILECLPIEDAVKTSALARGWRYKWTTLSRLNFGEEFTQYLEDISLLESDFVTIITSILLLHRGTTIHSFTLFIPDHYVSVDSGIIQNWILSLSRKGVKEFSLHYRECSPRQFYKLPSHLYAFLNLTHLYAFFCVFNPPSGFRGFPKLIKLTLYEVTLEKGSFGHLISSCPLLESLSVHVCFGSDHLNIYSPSLRDLYVGSEQRDGLESICVVAENLKTIWLDGSFRTHLQVISSKNKVNNMIEELDRLPEIEELIIGWCTFESITTAGAPKRLPRCLIHLKKVRIDKINLANYAQGTSALCLIRSAPNLQELRISGDPTASNDVEQVSSFARDDWELKHLHTVIFSSLRGLRPELELIKTVLASSPSLNLMDIHFDDSVDLKVCSWVSEEVLKVDQASPKVEVRYRQNGRFICFSETSTGNYSS